jgi:DNA (cytosine-5)-methyltransferase 1
MQTSRPVAVDLFAGAGGLGEGFLAAGINVAVAVEHHPHAALTNSFNHPGTSVICGGIVELDCDMIRAEVKKRTGKSRVDIVAGGPPCQGFSSAGKQESNDPRNKLIHEFVRVVDELSPCCFVFENVPAIVDASDGKIIQRLLDDFWDLGFKIFGIDNSSDYYPCSYPVIDSSWFGVPQARKRLILVGWKRDRFDDFHWLSNSMSVPTSRRAKKVTIYDAISDLEFLEAGFECHSYPKQPSSSYQIRRRANTAILLNHLASDHRKETIRMFRRYQPGQTVSSIPFKFRTGKQRVRRFSKSDLSPAILALPDDFIHYSQNRIPTVRELARLQSFDDDFVFLGKRTTSDQNRRYDVPQYTQVGNAVPPLLARSLGRAILKSLGFASVDNRSRITRRKRIGLLCGSSAYSGYGLKPDLVRSLELYDIHGNKLALDVTDSPAYLSEIHGPVPWSGRDTDVA